MDQRGKIPDRQKKNPAWGMDVCVVFCCKDGSMERKKCDMKDEKDLNSTKMDQREKTPDRQKKKIPTRIRNFSLLQKPFRPTVVPNQPPIQWILLIFPGVKRPGHNFDHSPPPRSEVKNEWSYSLPLLPLMPSRCVQGQH
jgi:hypothetical protein